MDRVSEILSKRLLGGERPFWLLDKYLRRGRLVDYALTLLAQGKIIEAVWWEGHSGEGDDDRVEHEECRSYIGGGERFLRENKFRLTQHHFEVIHPTLLYQGHPDWLGLMGGKWVIDIKCGPPPAAKNRRENCDKDGHIVTFWVDNPMDLYERYQLALYVLPLGRPVRRANLHVFDGTYRFVERTQRNDLWEAQALVQYHHIMKRMGE